ATRAASLLRDSCVGFSPTTSLGMQFLIRKNTVRRLGPLKNFFHKRLFLRIAMRREPVNDIRKPTHWADFDDLFQSEHAGRDAGVDAVREPVIALLLRLDDRGRVHARACAEGIASDD